MNNIVFLRSKFGSTPRTWKECVAIDIAACSILGKCSPYLVTARQTHSPPSPPFPNIPAGQTVAWNLAKSCVFSLRITPPRQHLSGGVFWGAGGVKLEDWLAHAQTRVPGKEEGVLEQALMPRAATERPHSRITSQKRLASCDTANRMAFVSFRIMSSPGHITLNKTTSEDANVITAETMLSLSVNIYYMSLPVKFTVNIHDLKVAHRLLDIFKKKKKINVWEWASIFGVCRVVSTSKSHTHTLLTAKSSCPWSDSSAL